MKCGECKDQFSNYLDGGLPTEERRALDTHLLQCPDCQTRLRSLRSLKLHLQDLPSAQLPPAFRFGMRRALLATDKRWSWWRNGYQRAARVPPVAVGGFAGVLAALVVTFAMTGPPPTNGFVPWTAESKPAPSVNYVLDRIPVKGQPLEGGGTEADSSRSRTRSTAQHAQ